MSKVDLKALVIDFQTTRLDDDQKSMVGFEGQGRAVLYNQLQEAYRIGKLLLTKGPNRGLFENMLEDAGMDNQAKKLNEGKATNEWVYVTKLLYGKFVEKTFLNTVFQEFEPNRSAEKYGNVLRYLDRHNVKVEEAANFIANFKHEEGNALAGIEAVDRKEARGSGSTKDEKLEDTFFKFGTSSAAADVVQFEMPAEWYDDKRFKSDNKFGTCWFEVKDGKVFLYDRKPMKEDDFTKLAKQRGRRVYYEQKATQKQLDNIATSSGKKLKAAEKIKSGDPDLAVIKIGAAGQTTAGYKEMLYTLHDEANQDANNAKEHRKHLSDIAAGKLGVDPKRSIVLIKNNQDAPEEAEL